MSIEKLQPPESTDSESLEAMKMLFPEIFADGRINLDALKEALPETVEDDEAKNEHYGLTWPGKRAAKKLATLQPTGTLMPMPGEGVDEKTTKNIIIEGDNLEVLRILQKSYVGRIKMIYIDPPYNTGQDLIYKDDFKEPVDTYLRRTGQADEEGLLTSNPKASGRFHSNWLSMMYPRLKLARNLLHQNGVIFISIDSNEIHNLRLLMNEIFGEECFVADITLLCNPKGRSQDKYFATNHEYIVIYSRTQLPKGYFSISKDDDQIEAEYPDEDEGGKYRLLELRNTHREFGKHNRKNLFYPFFVSDLGDISLEEKNGFNKVLPIWDDGYEGCWTWDQKKAGNDFDLVVAKKVSERWKIYRKSYANGADKMLKTIFIDNTYYTERGQREFNSLFNTKNKIFQSPKSPLLLSQIIKTVTNGSDIILDFFAGSGTTAQAVFELNREDGENRKFILVQLPEKTNNEEYITIAHITRERVRRVISKIKETVQYNETDQQDFGFRSYSLVQSNKTNWKMAKKKTLTELEDLFVDTHKTLVPGWKPTNVIVEMMLIEGFPLDSVQSKLSDNKDNNVLAITHPDISHSLFICLDETIQKGTIARLHQNPKEDILICLDSALDDQAKLTLSDALKVKTL